MGSTVIIYYQVNIFGIKYNWTKNGSPHEDCGIISIKYGLICHNIPTYVVCIAKHLGKRYNVLDLIYWLSSYGHWQTKEQFMDDGKVFIVKKIEEIKENSTNPV